MAGSVRVPNYPTSIYYTAKDNLCEDTPHISGITTATTIATNTNTATRVTTETDEAVTSCLLWTLPKSRHPPSSALVSMPR